MSASSSTKKKKKAPKMIMSPSGFMVPKPSKKKDVTRKIQSVPKPRKSRAKYTEHERKVIRAAAARALTTNRIKKVIEKTEAEHGQYMHAEREWLEAMARDPNIYLSQKTPPGGIWEPMRGPMAGNKIKPRTFKERLAPDGQVYLVPNVRASKGPKKARSAKQVAHSKKISDAAKLRKETAAAKKANDKVAKTVARMQKSGALKAV